MKYKCPECGSTDLMKYGTKFVKADGKRVKRQQYQCKSCGRITVKPVQIDGK